MGCLHQWCRRSSVREPVRHDQGDGRPAAPHRAGAAARRRPPAASVARGRRRPVLGRTPVARRPALERFTTGNPGRARSRAGPGVATGARATTPPGCSFDGAEWVGSLSIHRIDRDQGDGEIGYWIALAARGRGLAGRAAAAACRWAFADLGLHRIQLFHAVENVASARVAEKAGFTCEGRPAPVAPLRRRPAARRAALGPPGHRLTGSPESDLGVLDFGTVGVIYYAATRGERMMLDDELDRPAGPAYVAGRGAPRPQRRTGWVLGGALAVVAVVAGVGVAAVGPHRSPAPTPAPSSAAAAPSTPAGAAPAPMAGEAGRVRPKGCCCRGGPPARGALGRPADRRHRGDGDGAGATGAQLQRVRRRRREAAGVLARRDPRALGGLAARVTVRLARPRPPASAGSASSSSPTTGGLPGRDGAAWPTTDTFERSRRTADHRLRRPRLRRHGGHAAGPGRHPQQPAAGGLGPAPVRRLRPAPPRRRTPTVGQFCSGDRDAVCAPLG